MISGLTFVVAMLGMSAGALFVSGAATGRGVLVVMGIIVGGLSMGLAGALADMLVPGG